MEDLDKVEGTTGGAGGGSSAAAAEQKLFDALKKLAPA